ncbi:hypothetical protein ACS0TY_011233 [Phlomoides rotata]
MRNDGVASVVGELPDTDIEKQQSDGTDGGGGGHGLAENAAVVRSEELVEKTIEVVIDCPVKDEAQLQRDSNFHEECRVCQEETEEVLINLGCQCRGGLAKAHQSCIIKWFNTRGSNKCEICQQVAANVIPPDSQASYWVWRVDPALRAQDRERGCFSPLWVAFSILVGGLLLDVLISVTLGVSALPVNIIIGVIVVLGLGTALRLGLEFCQVWNGRRVVQRVEANASLGYHPAL